MSSLRRGILAGATPARIGALRDALREWAAHFDIVVVEGM
jgi:hypothetical protein